jgi:hypothetical protein
MNRPPKTKQQRLRDQAKREQRKRDAELLAADLRDLLGESK